MSDLTLHVPVAHRFAALTMAVLALTASDLSAQISRYGLSTRVELHMLPAVTTGPLDPTWSPDGERLAYSMRGDIWVQALGSDEARAITAGPAYHFEPAWSPDGEWIALAVERDGDFDLAIVRPDGTGFRRLTSDEALDLQPAWAPDGSALFFASSRSWDFDVMRVDVATGRVETVVGGGGNQFQPAPSPDGTLLTYIAGVRGRLGSGGIWTVPLEGGDPELIHYEETSYRPAPAWTPDGSALIYASDAAGSYDLAAVPAAGGNRVRLTSRELDEFAPAVSPDGRSVAFVGNQEGPTALYVTSRFGDGGGPWQEVRPLNRIPMAPPGTLRGRVVGPDGGTVPARIQLLASDGRGYAPEGAFHRVSQVNEIHYFHVTGEFEVEVPAGEVRIEAVRGFEWIPADETLAVAAGEVTTVELRLERLADPGADGWISGDTHVHDLHEGRYGLTQREFFDQFRAEDVHVANALIHMDGTKLMGRWSDLTGADWEGSTDDHILRYAQEFRGSYGHVGLLGVSEFIMPLIGGTRGSPYPSDGLKLTYLDSIRSLGGIGGFMHPYTRNNGDVGTPEGAAQSDIPVHAILGRGDFYDLVSIASDEMNSAAIYYHMLNVGARLPATGGTDNFSNVWRDPSGGTARTYARVEGDPSWDSWIDAVRGGRTVATNGPLLFATVEGREPGSTLAPTDEVTVSVDLATLAPVDTVEILVDGVVRHTRSVSLDERRLRFTQDVPVEGARWIAVRARGPKARYSGDDYAFAHTSPVYFDGVPPNAASRASADFLESVIREIAGQVERRDAWTRPEDREEYRRHIDEALARLERVRGSRPGGGGTSR